MCRILYLSLSLSLSHTHTISIFEHDPDIFQYRRSVRVVIDQEQWSHLGVIEAAVWHSHITKPGSEIKLSSQGIM